MTGILSGLIGSMKGATAPKTAPTSLSAIPVNTSVAISFTAPSDDGGSPITNYEYSFNNSSWTALSPADAVSPITVSSLTQNTAYSIYLRAVNVIGSGPASSVLSFTTEGVPTGTATISSVTTGVTTATVTFSVAGGGGAITGYDLYITNFTNAWNATTASPISVTGLSAYSSYDFYVRAKNGYGVGPQSAAFTASTINVPATTINAVTNRTESRGTFNATISANGSSTAVKFQYNTNNNFAAYTEVSAGTVTTQSAAVSATVTGLSTNLGVDVGGVTYYIRTVAVNSAGTTTSGVTSFQTWGVRQIVSQITSNFTVPTVPGVNPSPIVELFMIGGGGGGSYLGGGGGSGGYITRSNIAFTGPSGYINWVTGGGGGPGLGGVNGGGGTASQFHGTNIGYYAVAGGEGGIYQGRGGNVGGGDHPSYTGGSSYTIYPGTKSEQTFSGGGAGTDGNGGNASSSGIPGNGGPGNGFWGTSGGGGGALYGFGTHGSPNNIGAGGNGGSYNSDTGARATDAGATGVVVIKYYGP